jgi:hypothetical protein
VLPQHTLAPVAAADGIRTGKLCDALVASFDEEALEMLLWLRLNKQLSHLVPRQVDFVYKVFRLVRRAEQEDWAPWLVAAAYNARPENVALRELATGLTEAADGDVASLERVISKAAGFQDSPMWRRRQEELEGQVCRVEYPVGAEMATGTGLLVAPDLVLTNYHVVEPLHSGRVSLAAARLRFDHKIPPDGGVASPGTTFGLADDWLVAWRPQSPVDRMRDPRGGLPGKDELDFALLRLREAVGHRPVQSPRGWVRLRAPGEDRLGLGPEDTLIVLQHPQDVPLKMAHGKSLGLNGNATRLRHTVNTRGGSSGSPCLNVRLEVVAIHHAGDPNFDASHKPAQNAAIPVAEILDYLAGTAAGRELSG